MTTVAVIGGGAAGIGAARRLLLEGLRVILIEPALQLGGNCAGIEVRDASGAVHVVDAGVSDFNRATFHHMTRLLLELELPTQPIGTDAHFASVAGESLWALRGGEWTFRRDPNRVAGGTSSSDLIEEMRRFRTRALEVLADERFARWTVARYLDHIGASSALRTAYLYPRAIGCFPMPNGDPRGFGIRSLVRFWNVHGIVSRESGDRCCVVGGMHRYVRAFERWFEARGGTLRCGTRVCGITRAPRHVDLYLVDRQGVLSRARVHHVILAMHAHAALGSLEDATSEERAILGSFRSRRARVVVHRDARLMGSDRSLWGAFHYVVPEGELPRVRPTITFYPHRLAGLPAEIAGVFVTLNPHREPRPETVIAERNFVHPLGTTSNERAIARAEALQGGRRTWFAGSYLRAPYVHESALASGIEAAERLIARERGEVRAAEAA